MRHDAVPGVHRAPPGPKWESPLKAVLLASVAALALGGCATTQTAPTAETVEPATVAETPVAAPAHILLAEWSGPYGGVPPFDKVTRSEEPRVGKGCVSTGRSGWSTDQ